MMVLVRYIVLYFLLNAAKQRIASSHPRSGQQTKPPMHCCVTRSIVFHFVYNRIMIQLWQKSKIAETSFFCYFIKNLATINSQTEIRKWSRECAKIWLW